VTGRPATVADVHRLALAMPHVTRLDGSQGKPVYQVGGKSFIFFRNPRPDARDPVTGERYDDVIVFWVPDEADKRALVGDTSTPFFTTPHFDGHPSVLIRARDLPGVGYQELSELVEDAWLCRASTRRAADWLKSHAPPDEQPQAGQGQPSPLLGNQVVVSGGDARGRDQLSCGCGGGGVAAWVRPASVTTSVTAATMISSSTRPTAIRCGSRR